MNNNLLFFLVSLILYSNLITFLKSVPTLHKHEVDTLRIIGDKLGLTKKNWNLDHNPCIGEGNWGKFEQRKGHNVSIVCDCTFEPNGTCHVVKIYLKSQNISATIPKEFSALEYLKVLDLSRNYISGTIPSEWNNTPPLTNLTLMGNRLSGQFPEVLTRMTTLQDLSLEGNRFSGSIPQEIGKLNNLQKLVLASNAFTGQLPLELGNLANLTDVRISDNSFTGSIPHFISQWMQIEKLHIQGCSLEGPIPSSISVLTKLTDLRISDLKGKGFGFPPLQNMTQLKKLILRNCLIHGRIPEYLGSMTKLKTLDLSFNNLTGEVPSSFSQLQKTDYIYLTENNLTGPVPDWVTTTTKTVDLSYNHVNINECLPKKYNIDECVENDFTCTSLHREPIHSLHINCGGSHVNISNTVKYQGDSTLKGDSTYNIENDWAFRSAGNFLDGDNDFDKHIVSNTSSLHNVSRVETELYTTARTAAISLSYFGLCLINGSYTVRLHFAEIVFSQDNTFNSLGKRVFDVYVQGVLKLKDFDIAKEAGGAGRPIIKSFMVDVTSNTLGIQLYWAGKGTTGIPFRGTYGPLISAISVDPNFKPQKFGGKINVGLVVGIVAGVLFFVFLIAVYLWRYGYIMGQQAADLELIGLDLQAGRFTLRQIKAATNNFDPSNKLGEGGFGAVYKGLLSDGMIIAVKQLSSKSSQGSQEFVNEVGIISALQHPNLVKLYGCCTEGNQLSLVYEYMENNCLSRALFGEDGAFKARLTWPVRLNICLGIARGLVYIHEDSQLRIIHRDIKASNVLLDGNLNAKISDFGLAKLVEDGKTHINTRIAGTTGYMAPEYAMRGCLTAKADVYSFGIVALEIVSGKSNNYSRFEQEQRDYVYLLDWACVLKEQGKLLELVDPDLGSEYSPEEALTILKVALLCTNASWTLRPSMSEATKMLEGRTKVRDLPSDPGPSTSKSNFQALRNDSWQSHDLSETFTVLYNQEWTHKEGSCTLKRFHTI